MSQENRPNPFKSARRLPGLVVHLDPRDIVARQPDLTIQQSDELLNRHGHAIAASMIQAGVEAAIALHQSEGRQPCIPTPS
jgi:hypothetical protein